MFIKFIVILSFILISVSSITAQSSEYHDDAVQLSARLSVNEFSLEISEHLIFSIEDALWSISQSQYVAAKNIFHKYNIKAATTTSTNKLKVIVGNDASWIDNLSKSPINNIYDQFTIEINDKTEAYTVLNVSTTSPLNLKYVANELSVLDDIWMVELPSIAKIHNDIKLEIKNEIFYFKFSLEVANCEIGCDKFHYWDFEVDSFGNVKFIREYGADLNNAQKAEEDFYSILNESQP